MESFFALLRKCVLNTRSRSTRIEPRLAILTWIEKTHHSRRQHSLGRSTPIEFEAITTTQAASAASPEEPPQPSAAPSDS